ncbi:MAG: transglycosylase SLT domain-containing protein [Thioalkalivibrionaceae bacterium]
MIIRRRLRPRASHWHRLEWLIFLALLAVLALWVWLYPPSALQLALFREHLRVVLVVDSGVGVSPAVDASQREVYRDPTLAFEKALFERLAQTIGTRLKITTVSSPDEARILLLRRQADAAGGLLLPSPDGTPGVRNGPEILPLTQVLVAWNPTPQSPSTLTLDNVEHIGLVRGMPIAALLDTLIDDDLEPPAGTIDESQGSPHDNEWHLSMRNWLGLDRKDSLEGTREVKRHFASGWPASGSPFSAATASDAPPTNPIERTYSDTPADGSAKPDHATEPDRINDLSDSALRAGRTSDLQVVAANSSNSEPEQPSRTAPADDSIHGSTSASTTSGAAEISATRSVKREHFANTQELLYALQGGLVDVALLHSVEFRNLARDVPELTEVAELPETGAVWWFSSGLDASLANIAEQMMTSLRASGELDRLIDRFFGHLDIHGLIDTLTLQRHVQTRLPPLRAAFEAAGSAEGLDWRLLAALGYQESQWDPNATSPTGVRGVMMLTNATAREVGISDRLDPQQSIEGGARYLAQILERLPDAIEDEDRLWFALAAYNVGLGHLFDARRLAMANGHSGDEWVSLVRWLPKLAEREWHSQTRYGYARGWEPVHLVTSVRSYYDWLLRLYPDQAEPGATDGGQQPATVPALPLFRTL